MICHRQESWNRVDLSNAASANDGNSISNHDVDCGIVVRCRPSHAIISGIYNALPTFGIQRATKHWIPRCHGCNIMLRCK